MRITFSLSDEQYAAADRTGVMVGLPLTVQLHGGLLAAGPGEDPAGWFQPAGPAAPKLMPLSLDRCAFLGRITELELWRDEQGVIGQALLDCGCPLRVDLFDPDSGSDPPHGLGLGDWLLGIAALQGYLAFDPGDLLWRPVDGTIVDIQRLTLDPLHPDFGLLRWLHSLPRRTFGPDQVFVTVEM